MKTRDDSQIDTNFKTFIIIWHPPFLHMSSLELQRMERKPGDGQALSHQGLNRGALRAGSQVRTTQLRHVFKHKVNRSSLASLPETHWECFTFLRNCRLGRRDRGGCSSSGHSSSHIFCLANLPRSPWGCPCIHSPGVGHTTLVRANALCRLQILLFHRKGFHFLWLFNILAPGEVLLAY